MPFANIYRPRFSNATNQNNIGTFQFTSDTWRTSTISMKYTSFSPLEVLSTHNLSKVPNIADSCQHIVFKDRGIALLIVDTSFKENRSDFNIDKHRSYCNKFLFLVLPAYDSLRYNCTVLAATKFYLNISIM